MKPACFAVLDRYPASARPLTSVEPLGNAGGLSGARLWRFESARGRLVLRCWPVDGPGLGRLAMIHGWLTQAGGLGFVPVPIASLDGRSVVEWDGRRWEVAPWMPGAADLSRPAPLARVRAAFAGLAAFHGRLGASRSEGRSPGLISRVAELERLVAHDFRSIRAILAESAGDPGADLARRWLDRAALLAPGVLGPLREASLRQLSIQPCLRDARPDHFLFEGDRLAGLVDFGAMGRDSVSGDLARLLAEGVGPDPSARSAALDAYASVLALGPSEVAAVGVIERANALLGPARWVRWHFSEGRTFEDPGAVARGLRRGLERLRETF